MCDIVSDCVRDVWYCFWLCEGCAILFLIVWGMCDIVNDILTYCSTAEIYDGEGGSTLSTSGIQSQTLYKRNLILLKPCTIKVMPHMRTFLQSPSFYCQNYYVYQSTRPYDGISWQRMLVKSNRTPARSNLCKVIQAKLNVTLA